MAKPKYEAWSKAQRERIEGLRKIKGYGNLDDFVSALRAHGADMSVQAWQRRERGETPIMIHELVAFADVLGVGFEESARLFSRPEYGTSHIRMTHDLPFAQ